MRLYKALCGWLEASARQMDAPVEFYPEGAGAASVEHAHSYTSEPELHAGSEGEGAYRSRKAGF